MQLGLNIVFQPTLTKLRLGKVRESIAKRWAGGFPLRDQFGEDLIKFARVFTGNDQGPGEQAVLFCIVAAYIRRRMLRRLYAEPAYMLRRILSRLYAEPLIYGGAH